MEAYEIDTIKIEKEKAMRRYRTFRKIANIVRTLEFFVVLLLVFWSISLSSAYFPAAVKLSGSFFRRVFSLLFSPHFVFIIGNVIVITLFAKSGDRPASEIPSGDAFSGEVQAAVSSPAAEPEIVPAEEDKDSEVTVVEEKTYRRTKSSVEMVIFKEEKKKELRRSETEPRREIGNGELTAARRRRMYDVDELSNEEFRRKVEAFIEKQQKLLREESKAVVLNNRCLSL